VNRVTAPRDVPLVSDVPHDETPPEPWNHGSEGEPCSAAIAGAPAALAEWLEGMRPRVVRLAMRFLWNRHDAEEVAQDAILTAWERIGRLREPSRQNAWLYRITIHLSTNRLRRRQACPLPSDETLGQAAAIRDSAQTRGELVDRVREAIMELPERQYAAIVLRDMEGLAYEQIAAILDVRPGAVRVLVHRAREAVRETVARRWPECLGPDDG
jgi:RNA polymerase sigma-70 factor (ECF subfamily)